MQTTRQCLDRVEKISSLSLRRLKVLAFVQSLSGFLVAQSRLARVLSGDGKRPRLARLVVCERVLRLELNDSVQFNAETPELLRDLLDCVACAHEAARLDARGNLAM